MSQKWKVVLDFEIIPLVRGDGVFLVVMVTDALTRRITQIDFKTFAQPERENVVFFFGRSKLNQLYLLIVVTSFWVRKSVMNTFNYIYIYI